MRMVRVRQRRDGILVFNLRIIASIKTNTCNASGVYDERSAAGVNGPVIMRSVKTTPLSKWPGEMRDFLTQVKWEECK